MAHRIGMIILSFANLITTSMYLFMCFIFFNLLKGHFEQNVVVAYSMLAAIWFVLDGVKWFAFIRLFAYPKSKWIYYQYVFAVALILISIKFPIPFIYFLSIFYLIGAAMIHHPLEKT